jgi:hypothetical protein
MKQVIGFFLALSLFLSATDASEFRQWKDIRGNAIEAKLLKDNGNGTISIQKSDGWRGNVPLSLLSLEDQEYVKTAGMPASTDSIAPELSKNFEVFRIRQEKVPGYIGTKNGWEHRIECIEAELRYHGSTPAIEVFAKAYFYDKNGQEIERFASPPSRQDESGEYVTMPKRFEPGGKYEVYFPITTAINEKRWKSVLVVFGNELEVGALSDPETALIAFDFDEKKLLFPDWEPALAGQMGTGTKASGAEAASADLIPEMKAIKREKTPYSVSVDGKWESKYDSLTTEIRVTGDLPKKITAKAYFFNESKALVTTRNGPALTNVGQGRYVGLPVIADADQWYPVYFPINKELQSLEWTWAVVAFDADGKVAAEVFGPRGVAVTDFTFPGSDKLWVQEGPK